MFEYKTRYLGSFILIVLGCMLFVGLNFAGASVDRSVDRYLNEHVVEDAQFIVKDPVSSVSEVEKDYQIQLEERVSYDYQFTPSSTLRILNSTEKIDTYSVVKGQKLQQNGEILLDPKYARAHDLPIGSSMDIEGENYKIVGYVALPDYILMLKSETDLIFDANAFGVAVVSKSDMNHFPNVVSFYSVKFQKDNKSEFQNYLTQSNSIVKWMDQSDNPRIKDIDGTIDSFILVGKVVPIVVLILTCVLISIVQWRLLKNEFVQIGTFYALGYRKGEIARHYLMYSLILCLAGSMAGTAAGFLIANPIASLLDYKFNLPIVTMHYDVNYIWVSFLLPFVIVLPTTYVVLRKGLQMPPLLLISGGKHLAKVNFLERNLKLDKFSFNVKYRIREFVRNIPVSLLLVFGITFSSLLLLFGFATKDSLNYFVKDSYEETYQYNYNYIFKSPQSGKPKIGEILSASPHVIVAQEQNETKIAVYGIEPDAEFIRLVDGKGNEINKDQVIVTKPLADTLNLRIGDELAVQNKLNAKQYKVRVDQIADTYIGNAIFMPISQFNILNGYPVGSYMQIMSYEKLNLEKGTLLSEVKKDELINSYRTVIRPIESMIGVVAVIAFIIGLIIIYIITSMIIEENHKTISLLKVLGYSQKRIYTLLLSGNSFLVLLGYLLALPLIMKAMEFFFSTLGAQMQLTIPVRLNTIHIFIAFLIIFITYHISSRISRRKVIDISMVDTLKSRAE
ncbi:ABC transporter permease [Paenibacillus sp. FSL H7-0350]|uniref:ABC transporter permease n=1 Tax=Paenibacillus sp. FSL H7-0350 TaxID=2975345 RepID=UPI00315965BB